MRIQNQNPYTFRMIISFVCAIWLRSLMLCYSNVVWLFFDFEYVDTIIFSFAVEVLSFSPPSLNRIGKIHISIKFNLVCCLFFADDENDDDDGLVEWQRTWCMNKNLNSGKCWKKNEWNKIKCHKVWCWYFNFNGLYFSFGVCFFPWMLPLKPHC